MTFSLEFEAKNVEKAVEKACAELNIPKDEICYDVLSPGSSGIFGLAGAKKARIRVNLPETPESERDIPGKNEISEELAGNSSSTQKNVMDVVEPEMTTPNFFRRIRLISRERFCNTSSIRSPPRPRYPPQRIPKNYSKSRRW
jgi:predicted RNA-binding protein Jag